MIIRFVWIFLLFWLVTPATAADFDRGLAAYDNGDYSVALQEFRSLAEDGHAGAQYQLGRMYDKGKGVASDNRRAAGWYQLAAEQGIERAQVELGHMYDSGRGVPTDRTAAAYWFLRAARQGDPEAQVQLGYKYAEGSGVPRDIPLAVAWFSLVVLRDDFEADETLEKIRTFLTERQMAEARELSKELAVKIPGANPRRLRF